MEWHDSYPQRDQYYFGKYYYKDYFDKHGQDSNTRVKRNDVLHSMVSGCTDILREKALADGSLLDKLKRMTYNKDYGNFSCFVKYKEDDDRLLNLFIHGDGENKSKYVGSTFLIKKKDTVEQFKEK